MKHRFPSSLRKSCIFAKNNVQYEKNGISNHISNGIVSTNSPCPAYCNGNSC